MPLFKKKPVVIEAVQYGGGGDFIGTNGGVPDWAWKALETGVMMPTNGTDPLVIRTLEGNHVCSPGDWIIKGVEGELYPCKPGIFAKTYEPACSRNTKVSKSAGFIDSTAVLVERLVDEAMKIAMFDMPWDDDSVPEVKSNRDDFRSAFKEVIRKRR